MYQIISPFGMHVFGNTIGETWIDIVETVVTNGKVCFDEQRKRFALDNVRVKSETQVSSDPVITTFGNKSNLEAMLKLTFQEPEMYDCDVTPSFSRGAKSYFQRIQEGKLFDFVVQRLSGIPESKKAVIVFPVKEDYEQVLGNMHDDYLPCLVSVQFRLVNDGKSYRLNTTCNFRSMDVFQKGHGNLVALAKMTELLADRISANLGAPVSTGYLDGLIVDTHIYENTVEEARKMLNSYHRLK